MLASIPISSANWGKWSVLMTGSRYSRLKHGKADRQRLSLCTNLRYTNVLLAELNARKSIDWWSTIWMQWYAWEQPNLQHNFSPAMCCAALVDLLTGWLFWYNQRQGGYLFSNRWGSLLGFICANSDLAYLLNGIVVILQRLVPRGYRPSG